MICKCITERNNLFQCYYYYHYYFFTRVWSLKFVWLSRSICFYPLHRTNITLSISLLEFQIYQDLRLMLNFITLETPCSHPRWVIRRNSYFITGCRRKIFIWGRCQEWPVATDLKISWSCSTCGMTHTSLYLIDRKYQERPPRWL